MDTPNGSPGSGLLEIGPFGAQLKIRKSCSTIAQAGLSLVHSRALILKDCITFLWSCLEHTTSGPLCIYTNQPCCCLSNSPKVSTIVLFQEPACWPFPDCQLKTEVWWRWYFLIGNWFAPDSRIHEPNRGVWFWSLLQKNDFRVLLIDESLTSKCYPHCEENTLVTFRIAPSPHPYKRQGLSQGIRHDLLICTNQNCQVPIVNINDNNANNKHFRLWNHDLVSCLNVLHIASSLRENCQITERLKHDVSRQPRPREHTGNEKDQHPCHRPRNQ